MIIYFLRHASAGEHLANPKKDEKRALDKEGIEQCGYVGRALAALEAQVDVIRTAQAFLKTHHEVCKVLPGPSRGTSFEVRSQR